MKDNLEKAFKEKLDQFEVPYDASAWAAMDKRLDAQQSGGGNNLLKWVVGSAAVLATIAITSIYLFESESNTKGIKQPVLSQNEDGSNLDKNVTDSQNEEVNNDSFVSERSTENTIVSVDPENEALSLQDDQNVEEKEDPQTEATGNQSDLTVHEENDKPLDLEVTDQSNKPKYSFITRSIDQAKICAGESITISNNGAKNEIIKIRFNGDVISLKKAYSHTIKPTHSGTIFYLNGENEIIGQEDITVYQNPTPEFSLRANIYEDGLPVTKCEAYGDYEELIWNFGEDDIEVEGRQATHHFFQKGQHDVTLSVRDFNGCESTVTKSVRIDNNYNLMAVDAFKPHGNEPKNKTFMPFSLTQRDVQFTLTIVDPRDNGIVYSTQDPTKGWDGYDQRTGNMTPGETVYIWKVQLENPLPHERQVYAGTVVHD